MTDIFYFTGTGNSLYVARQLADRMPAGPAAMSKEECMYAIENAPLTSGLTWEELRDLTREP